MSLLLANEHFKERIKRSREITRVRRALTFFVALEEGNISR